MFSRAVHNAPDSSRYRLCRRHNRGHYCFVREISDGKTGGSPLTNCRSSSTRLLLFLRRPHPSFVRPLVFRRRVNVLVPFSVWPSSNAPVTRRVKGQESARVLIRVLDLWERVGKRDIEFLTGGEKNIRAIANLKKKIRKNAHQTCDSRTR